MSKHIQLHIPEPCHEKWNNMTAVEKGRFCGSCQKRVVDFTNMKDEQVVAFFKRQSTGSVCGRFMQDQLDRSLAMPKKRIPWVKYFFQFALPAFLLSTKGAAQGKVRVLTGDTVVVPVTPKVEAVEKLAGIEQKRERIIRGKVIDDTGEGISYATVLIKGTTTGVSADSIGNFSIKYSGHEKSIVLVSSSIGFTEGETVVNLDTRGESVTISLSADNMLKEVIVVAISEITCSSMVMGGAFGVVERVSFIDTIWKKVFSVEQFSKLYPNPVKRNSQLTIETRKHEKGAYRFQLSAMNGQVMLNKELWIDENIRVVKINIPPVADGAYFLQMINKQSGKRNTEKIIIE